VRKLTVFNHVSLDGYFTDRNNDMSWAHVRDDDPEWAAFVKQNAGGGGELVFGRVTYEMMAGYWPTPAAAKDDPEVAASMNGLPKVVFSRTLERADWSNTRVRKGDLVDEVRKLKQEPGPGLVLMGSGKIVAQLAPHRLIDVYQIVVNPVVLGAGRTMFEGAEKVALEQTGSRAFKNGKVLLSYEPA
jgi:dihydrofolate reductase